MYRDLESYSIVKNILLESVPKIEALKFRTEGEILIVVSREKKLFFLNEVAKDFLLLCNGQRTLAKIIDACIEIYDVEKDQLTNDLIDTIQDLQYKRILRVEAA